MNSASFYEISTGFIKSTMHSSNPDFFSLNVSDGVGFVEGMHDRETKYVKDESVVDRPTFDPVADKPSIAADGVEVLTITKLPRGTTSFELLGPVMDSWTETRLKTDLTINVPGHYKLKITQWPYQDREIEFDAT